MRPRQVIPINSRRSHLLGTASSPCADGPLIYRTLHHVANVKRALASRDLTMASLLILSFSGYLSPHFDERTVLGL